MSNEIEKKSSDGVKRDTEYWQPAVDVLESDQEYLVVADMPGLDPNGIGIELDRDMLVIEGTTVADGLDEILYRRSFRVMKGLESDKVRAEYRQGVLRVHLPKPTAQQPRRIQVTTG